MAVIAAHLVVSFVHGAAHARAHVPLSRAANLFVYIVILAGPLIGLAVAMPGLKTRPTSDGPTSKGPRIGSLLIAVTMPGSLVFGLVNHFVLSGPDHVAHVDSQWRALFGATAVLLALTEALGSGLAWRLARERMLS